MTAERTPPGDSRLHLPVTQAALGAAISFETLDGHEDLVVPRGTQTGKVFRLRGRGVPHVRGRGRGDLLVRAVVDTPTELEPEVEEALRQIAAPLLRSPILATWCIVFIGTIRELSATILLTTSETKVISVVIYDLNESGDLGAIAVMGLAVLLVTFAIVLLVNRLPILGGRARL